MTHRNLARNLGSRSGFTLIELVIVLLILAALAGLVIPAIGMLGRSTDMAVSAKTQSDLSANTQLFFVLQKRYPQGLDSLLDTTGAIYGSDTTDANTQTRALPYGGADGTRVEAELTVGTLTGNYRRSFSRSGFDWVFDHDTTVTNSNNSATTQRVVSSGDILVAEVNPTGALALKLVPQGLQSGERLVALGFGPRNSAIGKTVTNSPIYPGCDGKYYGRYILYFKVYASGERATIVGCSDSYGRTPDYTQQQFNESLPDGGRQG